MPRDLNVYPYYDSSVLEYIKNYKQILFRPNRAVQARELTGIASLNHQQNISNWNTLYKNGSIIEDCNITISESNGNTYANLSAGKFFFDARVLDVESQQILIDGTGEENLGFYVEETFISYTTDEDLKDPAYGYTNYGLAGADRLKIEVKLVKILEVETPRQTLPSYQKYEDESNVNVIWNLEDGIVQNYIRKPDYSLLTQTLAKRTYDESGHYLVEGMLLDTAKAYDTDKIRITISPGTCYVKGFETTFIVEQSVDVLKSLTTTSYLNEPHTFVTGTVLYQLTYPYVNTSGDITITAIIKETILNNRGSGDYDEIQDAYGYTYTSIESIVDIPGYVQSIDFELAGDQVHWIGAKPTPGSDYTITFRYLKNGVRDTDFTIVLDPYEALDIYYVQWLGIDDPDNNTLFLVDYTTYKARTDLVSIDKSGNIVIKSGIPTDYDETEIPSFNQEMLPLGWIKFFPGKDYDEAINYEYNFKRTTMFELHRIKQRLTDLEENFAALILESEVKQDEDLTLMKGLFVDPFNSLYRAEVDHPDYYASTNLVSEQLTMVSDVLEDNDFNRNNDIKTNIKTLNDEYSNPKYFTLNYSSKQTFFSQTLKSGTINLNPFGFIKANPYAKLSPPGDSWINTEVKEKTIVQNQVTNTTTNIRQLQWVSNPNATEQLVERKLTSIGEKQKTQKVELADKLITFARNTVVTIQGTNFEPISKLTCIVNGIYVRLTAIFPYRNEIVLGSSTGKILVASNGTFKGTFTIPPRTRSGNIEIKLIDENDNEFKTIFKSKGVLKIIENRTTVTKNFEKTIDIYDIITPTKDLNSVTDPPNVITDPSTAPISEPKPPIPAQIELERIEITKDPVAQSFIFNQDRVLIGIDLWFATKADDNPKPVIEDDYYNPEGFQPTIPATLQVGYMINGFPDANNIIHIQEIYPEDITTSLYGTIATYIELTKPIYIPALKEFFISIGSKSTEYTIFIAETSKLDITTNNVIVKQPYQDGSLFTSSNGITWTAVQEKDLTIRLYEGNYNTTGSIVTENITFPISTWTGYGRFLFMNEYIEVPNSKITFYYSTDAGTTYKIFNPSDEIAFDFLATQLKIKMDFSTDLTNISSILEYTSNLIFFKYDITEIGQYRTKPIENVPTYNSVKLIIDENTPSNTSLQKEFSIDGTLFFRFVRSALDGVDTGKNFYRNTYLFEFELLQKLSVSSVTGFAVGDNVKYVGAGSYTSKITAISGTDIYIILNDENETRYVDSHDLTNGTATIAINTVTDYLSEPDWPDYWVGRILLESTNSFRAPVVRNYRSIMKII